MLPCRSRCAIPLSAAAISADSPSRDFQPCQTAAIRTVQINRSAAMPSSRLSVPNALAIVLEKKPAKMAPKIAPPPTMPKTRFASRVVSKYSEKAHPYVECWIQPSRMVVVGQQPKKHAVCCEEELTADQQIAKRNA